MRRLRKRWGVVLLVLLIGGGSWFLWRRLNPPFPTIAFRGLRDGIISKELVFVIENRSSRPFRYYGTAAGWGSADRVPDLLVRPEGKPSEARSLFNEEREGVFELAGFEEKEFSIPTRWDTADGALLNQHSQIGIHFEPDYSWITDILPRLSRRVTNWERRNGRQSWSEVVTP